MAIEKPIGIAILVCDQILDDTTTNKRSLIGIFNTVSCSEFPANLQKLCVFSSITQINGRVDLKLRCTNETHEEVIVQSSGIANSIDPNTVLDLAFEFDKFSFPRPGLYNFELLAEDEVLLQTRFNVLHATPQQT